MVGDISVVTIIVGGILVLIVTIRMWVYESGKRNKGKQEKEDYRKEFFARKQREQEERGTEVKRE